MSFRYDTILGLRRKTLGRNLFSFLRTLTKKLCHDSTVAWLSLLAAAAAFHLSIILSVSAPIEFSLFAVALWAVAWLPVEELIPTLAYKHGPIRLFFLSIFWILIVVRGCLVRSYADPYIPLYPLFAVVVLVCLFGGVRLISRFYESLKILSLMPVLAWLPRVIPTDRLSNSAAYIASFVLRSLGVDVALSGSKLILIDASINVAGPCSGNEIMVQAFVVAMLALIVFPLPLRWLRLPFLLLAPLLGWFVNGLRVALLAVIASLDPASSVNDSGLFGFFHLGEGGMIFSGLGIAAYAYIYVTTIDKQLLAVESEANND